MAVTRKKQEGKFFRRFGIAGALILCLAGTASAEMLMAPPGGAPFAAAVNAPIMMRPFRIYVPTHVVNGRTVFGHLERIEVPLPVDAPLLSLSSIPNEPALPISGNP